jgi:hypothetical protein
MNRRELLILLGGAMTAAGAPRAEQKAMPVIGWLGISLEAEASRAPIGRIPPGTEGGRLRRGAKRGD